MFSAFAIGCVILGGLLEPMWVIAMKKSNSFHRPFWATVAIVLIIASPYCMSLSMSEMPVGTSYAIWTGIGAVCTVAVGFSFYKERIDRQKILFLSMIIIGVVGLSLIGGGSA